MSGPAVTALSFALIIMPLVLWLMWHTDFEGIRSECRYRRDVRQRERLTPQQFYDRYYRESGIDVRLVFGFLEANARFWGIDAERIRPEDNYLGGRLTAAPDE